MLEGRGGEGREETEFAPVTSYWRSGSLFELCGVTGYGRPAPNHRVAMDIA